MNPVALPDNLRHSRRACPSWSDRCKRMLWLYGNHYLLNFWLPRTQSIGFRYPAPVGDMHILVRNNRGADVFVFSGIFDHRYYELPLPFTPATILDLGANIGWTAIYFARRYPHARIACVEPMSGNTQIPC